MKTVIEEGSSGGWRNNVGLGRCLGWGWTASPRWVCTSGKMRSAQPEEEEWEERVWGSELDKEGWG